MQAVAEDGGIWWFLTVTLVAIGIAAGMVIGWVQTSKVCTQQVQEIQDILPSQTVSCTGKLTPCVESIKQDGS